MTGTFVGQSIHKFHTLFCATCPSQTVRVANDAPHSSSPARFAQHFQVVVLLGRCFHTSCWRRSHRAQSFATNLFESSNFANKTARIATNSAVTTLPNANLLVWCPSWPVATRIQWCVSLCNVLLKRHLTGSSRPPVQRTSHGHFGLLRSQSGPWAGTLFSAAPSNWLTTIEPHLLRVLFLRRFRLPLFLHVSVVVAVLWDVFGFWDDGGIQSRVWQRVFLRAPNVHDGRRKLWRTGCFFLEACN